MTQIRIYEGTATHIQKSVNAFLAQEHIRYVDLKYQVAGSDHLNASVILVYEDLSAPVPENSIKEESTSLQSALAIGENLDEISEQVAERLGLNK